ncbi:MAG: hypothetical protein J0M12_04165 [Deltaproteobacteria bacterium]|nr:hypothetical protein [Deltaproteobacteria bacterium]
MASMSAIGKAKAVVLIAAAFLFLAINRNQSVPKDPRQVEFETWLTTVESAGPSAQEKLQQQPISIALTSEYPEFLADWKLTSNGSAADARVMRMLQLAREGNLFSLGAATPPNASPLLRLKIERENRIFTVAFTREEIAQNLQAQSLLKLFEVYAGEQEAPASLSQP